jgi:hypothetical protein
MNFIEDPEAKARKEKVRSIRRQIDELRKIPIPNLSVVEQMMSIHEELYRSGQAWTDRHQIADFYLEKLSCETNKELTVALKLALHRFYRLEYSQKAAHPEFKKLVAKQLGCDFDVLLKE